MLGERVASQFEVIRAIMSGYSQCCGGVLPHLVPDGCAGRTGPRLLEGIPDVARGQVIPALAGHLRGARPTVPPPPVRWTGAPGRASAAAATGRVCAGTEVPSPKPQTVPFPGQKKGLTRPTPFPT